MIVATVTSYVITCVINHNIGGHVTMTIVITVIVMVMHTIVLEQTFHIFEIFPVSMFYLETHKTMVLIILVCIHTFNVCV